MVMWPKLDGVVHPGEYDCRIDDDAHPAQAYPRDAEVVVEFYYSFDGQSFNFGFRKLKPCLTRAAQIRLDPDRNGAEVGDLTVTVEPEDKLTAYGIYEGLVTATAVCGVPPDPRRAGASVKCSEEGDVEMWLDLGIQFENGLDPNPLEQEMAVHIAIQVELDGKLVTNFVNGIVPTSMDSQVDLAFD